MRVALLSHNARTGDAVGNQVAAKAAFFRDRGADVCVFVESDRDLQPDLRLLLRRVNENEPLRNICAELSHFDLLCIEYSQYFRLLDVLPRFGPRRPRIIVDYHGVTPPDLWDGPRQSQRVSQARRSLVWFADEVAVHSRFMRNELELATAFPRERIHELPLHLETEPCQSERTPSELRQRLGLGEARILLFVGRLARNKCVPVLIEALAKLRDVRPAVHALIVGDTGDLYQTEFQRCRGLAATLGVAERVHFLGRVSRAELAGAYRTADVFVMPSKHEGFCVPMIEAMAHGVPVIAARAAALPQTLGDAGLSFTPDDATDLARQIRRVLEPQSAIAAQPAKRAIAIVAAQYGDDALGGAEHSLRLVAETLANSGHRVEVFTAGRASAREPANGIRVHRFPADPVNADALAACTQQLNIGQHVSESTVHDYFALTQTSSRLLAELESRRNEFHAITAGPYASGLTWEVARRFHQQTLLLACLHDEPLAHQPLVREHYANVAGVLYHSEGEKSFAQAELGLHHPNSEVIGTWLDARQGNAEHGRTIAGQTRPYLVYCGRYCREKGVPTLIDWLKRYSAEYPDRFGVVFTGRGQVSFPDGIVDLGFLSDADKIDVMAGAAALVLLSQKESLSLAALEAWNQGVPVITHSECTVLSGHQRRCNGGAGVKGYEEFRDALNDLWLDPEGWREKGRRGREYIEREFRDRNAFASRLGASLSSMTQPLADVMTRKGLKQAAAFTPASWASAFAEQVERVLHREPVEPVFQAEVLPQGDEKVFAVSSKRSRLILCVRNGGTVPLLPDGPGATVIWSQVYSTDGESIGAAVPTRLAGILVPGQQIRLAVRVVAPQRPGSYSIGFRVGTSDGNSSAAESSYPLAVSESQTNERSATSGLAAIDAVHAALADAESIADLPTGYIDVTEGRLAKWKRKIKRKLLHQFQTAYVDVLSRQQSAFNRSVLTALRELGECAAMLERAVMDDERSPESASPDLPAAVDRVNKRVRQAVKRIADLEQRLERLESLVTESLIDSSKEGRS